MTDHIADAERIRDGLRCLQLSGAMFLRAELTAPWAYESPASADIVSMLKPGDRRIILFHIFTEGRCVIELGAGGGGEVASGDIAIFSIRGPAPSRRSLSPATPTHTVTRMVLPPPTGEPIQSCHDSVLMLMLPARHTADLLATSFALVAGAIGCGGGDEAPPMAPPEVPIFDSGRPKPVPDSGYMQPVGGSCVEADMKPCKVLLPAHGSIHPCFVGVQICTDGKWSACIDPPGDAGPADGGSAVN